MSEALKRLLKVLIATNAQSHSVVFARPTSTGSGAFFIKVCLNATKVVLRCVSALEETIYLKIWAKSMPKNPQSPLLVDVRPSKNACA